MGNGGPCESALREAHLERICAMNMLSGQHISITMLLADWEKREPSEAFLVLEDHEVGIISYAGREETV